VDRHGGGTITSDRLMTYGQSLPKPQNRCWRTLPRPTRRLNARLFGSAIRSGSSMSSSAPRSCPVEVVERWLDTGSRASSRSVPPEAVQFHFEAWLIASTCLRGTAPGHRLQVIRAAASARCRCSWALCAQERLAEQRGVASGRLTAAYVAFAGKRSLVPVIKAGKDAQDSILADARALLDIAGSIERGEFPPRPYEPRICSYCAYPSVPQGLCRDE
jgi:hypothetical protein